MFSLGEKLDVEKRDRSLVYTTYLTLICSGGGATILGALLPFMQEEYQMNYVLSGAVLSAHQAGNILAIILIGFLPYFLGRKKSMLVMSIWLFFGLILMTLTGNPILLMLAFAFIGMGRGTITNMSHVVISTKVGKHTAGLNILHACFAVGAFISPFVVLAASALWNWRLAPWILSALMLYAWMRELKGTLPDEKVERNEFRGHPFYRNAGFWIVTFILFFYLCSEGSLVGWLVTYFKDAGIMSVEIAQTMQGVLWLMIFSGRLTCAFISDRIYKPYLLITLGVMMTLSFVLMILSENIVLIVIGLIGVGFFMGGIYPTTYSFMPSEYCSSTLATGTCMAIATMGSILMPMIIGSVAEKSGIVGGITTISFSLVLMMLAMGGLIILKKRSRT